MTLTVDLSAKNGLSIVAGAAMLFEGIVPLTVSPEHLGWLRWQMSIGGVAVLGILAIIFQAFHSSKEEREQKQKIETILACVTKLSGGEAVQAKVELATAETVSVAGKSVISDIQISAKLLHGHLIQWHPLAGITDDFFRSAGREFHDTKCDFLLEVFLVNRSQTSISIQKIVGEMQIEEKWIPLKLVTDLNDYQFEFNDETVDNPSWIGGRTAKVLDLVPNLADDLKTSVLSYGIHHQGWLRFGAEINTKYLITPIPYRVTLVDALDGEHPVLTTEPLLTDGHIIHNPRVWRERLRSS
jgi:hypothetical protein